MRLLDIFSGVSRDIHLIKMTDKKSLDDNIKDKLVKKGWHEEIVLRSTICPSPDLPITIKYESVEFKKGKNYQGSPEWYRDLSSICYEDHKPGFLTHVLG